MTRPLDDPPGGVLMWVIITVELFTFGMIFVAIAHLRSTQSALFAQGQSALDTRTALVLTLSLVTSGWLTAEAVHSFRNKSFARARQYYAAAVVMGLIFIALKTKDFLAKFTAGFHLGVNDFWDAYFLSTGFHYVHVLVGIGLLVYIGTRAGKHSFEDDESAVGGTAMFWHMCDIIWFFLFPLFFARL